MSVVAGPSVKERLKLFEANSGQNAQVKLNKNMLEVHDSISPISSRPTSPGALTTPSPTINVMPASPALKANAPQLPARKPSLAAINSTSPTNSVPSLPPRKQASSPIAPLSNKQPPLPPRPQNSVSSTRTYPPSHAHTSSLQSISLESEGRRSIELTEEPSPISVEAKRWRPIDPRARQRYETLFEKQTALMQQTIIPGSVVGIIWKRSKLSFPQLKEIWQECHITQLDGLNKQEFCHGMWMIDETLRQQNGKR